MSEKKIGILGGGQLAMMLANAGLKLNVPVFAFCTQSNEPVTQILSDEFIVVGKLDYSSLIEFSKLVDIIIFESEFIPTDLLKQVQEDEIFKHKAFYPSLKTMAILQDKLKQKELCVANQIPTSKYFVLDEPILLNYQTLSSQFAYGAVLKWSRLGYDGKGNFFVNDWSKQKEDILKFIQEGLHHKAVTYAEEKINFKKELAIVAVKGLNQDFIHYPLVESVQFEGTCQNVLGPASNFGVSEDIETEAVKIAKSIADFTGIVGTFAIEFFLTSENSLLINEIAPRVHNSGHYSLDACDVDQFTNHLKAVLGVVLKKVKYFDYFAMRNILGPTDVLKSECLPPKPNDQTNLHWYYKQGTKPKRKLGHINICASVKEEFDKLWGVALEQEQNWVKSL